MPDFDDRLPTDLPLRAVLTRLAARSRRRVHVRRAWAALAVGAGLAAFLVAWESGAAGSAWRPAGYLAALGGLAAGLAAGVRGVRGEGPGPRAVAARIERLWPQTRGLLRDARAPVGGGLARAWAGAAEAWVARWGLRRLDRALTEEDRAAAAAW
ncbi:MAG TPA: hypothetical protein VM778_09220, partial [Gemmatimonadota bacterium]|nr:hypothetical protein [Gemmatimonadota bacterium]